MLKLYGFAVSNYYNMVKLALLEKGLPFEEVRFYPTQSPESLAISPRGKVPVLEVKQGFINETSVILAFCCKSGMVTAPQLHIVALILLRVAARLSFILPA